MRTPKPEWIAALRALTGQEQDTIRFNEVLHRWEFRLTEPGYGLRSQFFGWFYDPATRQPVKPDEFTGMYAFRELDDAAMREVLTNMERTFIGNPYDGAGTKRKEALRRMKFNRALQKGRRRAVAEAFAEMAQERGKRLRGALQLTVPGTVADTLKEAP